MLRYRTSVKHRPTGRETLVRRLVLGRRASAGHQTPLLSPSRPALEGRAKVSAKIGLTVKPIHAPVGGPHLAPRSTQHCTPVTHPHATSTLEHSSSLRVRGWERFPVPTERLGPCLFCPSCNRRLWSLTWQVASTRAWAESLHALDVYHTLDLADASSSGESRPGPQAVTPPSVFHPRKPSVRCWRPSRSIQTTGQLLPSSPEASQCSCASRSDFQTLTPTTSPPACSLLAADA